MQITRLPTESADGSTLIPENNAVMVRLAFKPKTALCEVFGSTTCSHSSMQMHYALDFNIILVKRTGNQRASMPVRKRRRVIPPSAATAHRLEDAYSSI